jgi:hypothetical protein
MAVNLSPIGGVAAQFFDNSGNVLSGGKIFTYAAGTTTPQSTYTSAAGTTPHANPIILDAAGRVPTGEIWLTDGAQYKFIIKTSTDVQIGSYDNIIGINSNFVNYTNSQEIQTATAGQTVFTLTTMVYQPGTNSLSVFVDGVNQYGPGASYAFQETSDTVVTFTSGLHVGADVKFTTSAINASSYGDAAQIAFEGFRNQIGNVQDLADADGADWIGFTPNITGSTPRSAQQKMRDTVSFKDFGAVGDGVTDDTAALFAMRDALINANATAQWYLKGSGGNYLFANNKWLCGLSNIDIDLEGGSLTYTSTSAANYDAVTFFGNPSTFAGPVSDSYGAGLSKIDALPIASVLVAETVLTFTSSGSAALFDVGEPIIVGGWEIQSAGYPPNLCVFEFNRVQSIDTGANTITVAPLRNSYKSTWPLVTTGGPGPSRGPAQVIKMLNRASLAPGVYWPNMMQNFSLKNGTVYGLRTYINFQMPVAERCNIENIKFEGLNVYGLTAEHLVFNRCLSYASELELDKLIDHVTITNSTFPALTSAAGVQKLAVNSSTIHGRFDVAPFSLTVRDSVIGPRFNNSTTVTTTVAGKATFENSQLLNGNTNGGGAAIIYNDFTSTSYTPTSISGNDLVFATYPDLRVNAYLMKTDGSVYGRILDISGSGPYTISVRWNTTAPTTGSSFYAFLAPDIQFGQTSTEFKYVGGVLNGFSGTEILPSPREATIIDKFMVPNMISSIAINVTKAGTGLVYVRGFGGTPTICIVDTATTGLRTVTPSSATGSQPGDDLTGYTNLTSFRPRLRFDLLPTNPDVSARPIYTLTINATPLINL